MTKLFSKADIDFKPITDYVSWFLDKANSDYESIQLPPIQRNSVWNSYQVERLWDSILRGFPIGSFLLSPRKKADTTRSIYSKEQTKSRDDGYFLLDGQQRTRAILLGFKPNSDSRLWIDLDPRLLFDNSEFNDRQFLFRLITKYQPWGMDNENPHEKLRENLKHDARRDLYGDSIRYDYDVKLNLCDKGEDYCNKYSWPLKSNLPMPFDSLIALCGGYNERFVQPEWKKVLEFIPKRFRLESNSEPTKHFSLIIDAIRNLLDSSDPCKRIRAVTFLFQEQRKGQNEANGSSQVQDPVEVLFRRINSAGTPLNGEELAYSLLKSSWDEAYDLVSKIVTDEGIGYLFSSTEVVMAATRIARFNLDKNDDANSNVSNFRKWIGEKEGSGSFLNAMKNLLTPSNDKPTFHSIVERFLYLVSYRGNQDIGLPRKLLLSIKPTMVHPILIWLYNNDSNNDERSRKPILRYLIYSFLGVTDYNKASKKAVELLRINNDLFPDLEIYKQWLIDEIAIEIPNVENFQTTLIENAKGFLRNWDEVMGDAGDIYRDFRNVFWNIWPKKELLLWFQREYVSKWFVGYDPMSNDAYDTPYDCDHIVPYSHLISRYPETGIADKQDIDKFIGNNRYLYINSIGNLRIWPSWANRSDKDNCHTNKMRMNEDGSQLDSVAKELLFKSNRDFISASFINLDDFDLWKKAGGEPREWPEKRRIAWQQGVENRVLFLFEHFYNSFGFSEWSKDLKIIE